MVNWIIGLAGAGKSTVGRCVYERLRRERPNVVFLDGDMVREIMGGDLGHTLYDRCRNAWRVCRLCRELDRQGIDVVCAILSIFREHQQWNRQQIDRYFEVYLDVSLPELLRRDQKKLYSRAIAGEIEDVVGIDLPFDPPHAHLVIENESPFRPPAALAEEIVTAMKDHFNEPRLSDVPIRLPKSA